jgi:hypothetical protein
MADVIAHKITATDSTGEILIQYVQPAFLRQVRNILQEEGYDIVNEEEVTELPSGVDFDVTPVENTDAVE